MKTPAKINASRDESGKMLIGLDGTGAGLLMLAGRIASGVLVTVASNEKELAELKNVMHMQRTLANSKARSMGTKSKRAQSEAAHVALKHG